MQGRVGFLLSGPSFQDPLPPPKPVSTKLYSPFLVAKGSSILGPRGPPLGETLASRWRREGGGKTAYPWLARINPYKLTKKRGYQLARSRGEPSSRGLPWFTMLKQKATHLAAHTSGHTHTRPATGVFHETRVHAFVFNVSCQTFRHTLLLRKYSRNISN